MLKDSIYIEKRYEELTVSQDQLMKCNINNANFNILEK